MDNNLIQQIAISVINSGKTTASITDSSHTIFCREIYAVLTNQVNVSKPFPDLCKNLLLSMCQKPNDNELNLFIFHLKEQVQYQKAFLKQISVAVF